MMIKAIIFDCFGVLLNDGLKGLVEELEKHHPEIAQEIREIVRMATAGGIDAHTSRERVATLLGSTLEEYNLMIKRSEVKNQALLDYITTLRPKYKTAILSNILSGGLKVRFPEGEAEKYFDAMFASGEIHHAKPDPRAYEIAAEGLGVLPHECVMVDDKEEFCAAARTVGMHAVEYRSFKQLKRDLEKLFAEDR